MDIPYRIRQTALIQTVTDAIAIIRRSSTKTRMIRLPPFQNTVKASREKTILIRLATCRPSPILVFLPFLIFWPIKIISAVPTALNTWLHSISIWDVAKKQLPLVLHIRWLSPAVPLKKHSSVQTGIRIEVPGRIRHLHAQRTWKQKIENNVQYTAGNQKDQRYLCIVKSSQNGKRRIVKSYWKRSAKIDFRIDGSVRKKWIPVYSEDVAVDHSEQVRIPLPQVPRTTQRLTMPVKLMHFSESCPFHGIAKQWHRMQWQHRCRTPWTCLKSE